MFPKKVENAVECLEVALQWAEFTENLEPLAQMATFNSLVEKALQQVEDGCESTIFNIEVFCNLCEELTGDSEELTREEIEKQEKDFLDSKKSTLAALVCSLCLTFSTRKFHLLLICLFSPP